MIDGVWILLKYKYYNQSILLKVEQVKLLHQSNQANEYQLNDLPYQFYENNLYENNYKLNRIKIIYVSNASA